MRIVGIFAVAALASAAPGMESRAESSAGPAVDSDYRPEKVKIETGPGRIDQKDRKLDASVSLYSDSDGSKGASAKVEAGKEYAVAGETDDDKTGATTVYLGGSARIDATGKAVDRLDLTLPGATLFVLKDSVDPTEKDAAATGRLAIGRVGATYRKDDTLGTTHGGVTIAPLEASGHASVRVGPAVLDACARLGIFDFIGGKNDVLGEEETWASTFSAGACAGITVANFRLRDDISYRNTGNIEDNDSLHASSWSVANTLSLEAKVSDSFRPRIAWTHETGDSEHEVGGDNPSSTTRSHTRDFFTVGVAY